MNKAERDQIIADGKWWEEFADVLGWRVIGFSFRSGATLIDKHNRTISITGDQALDILHVDREGLATYHLTRGV